MIAAESAPETTEPPTDSLHNIFSASLKLAAEANAEALEAHQAFRQHHNKAMATLVELANRGAFGECPDADQERYLTYTLVVTLRKAGMTNRQAADVLNAAGRRTARGLPFNLMGVAQILSRRMQSKKQAVVASV